MDMLEVARNLLAKAERTTFPEEALSLTNKAQELISKYGLEQAILNAQLPKNQREKVAAKHIIVTSPFARDKANLIHGLSSCMGCMDILHRVEAGKQDYVMEIFGFPADLRRLELLYTSLLTQAVSQLIKLTPPAGVHGRAFNKSWFIGFINAVIPRVRAAEANAFNDSTETFPGTAVVLLNKSSDVERIFNEMYPKTRKVSASKTKTSAGYEDGSRAGNRADIGHKRVGEQRKRLR